MDWRGGTGEVVDSIDLDIQREGDVVPQQLEVGAAEQMGDVATCTGEKVSTASHRDGYPENRRLQ
jgi:hypothetical protein